MSTRRVRQDKTKRPMDEHELRAAIRDLEAEAAGEPFDDDQRERWNKWNEELDELETRRQRVADIVAGRAPGQIEAGVSYSRGGDESQVFPEVRDLRSQA